MIPDKDLTDDVLDEIIAGAKTSMEQYLALSLKAERKVWRQEGPTDDERIMAIEGIHNCERCGDEGWVVGEMGITRCACNQGNPVFKIDLNSDFIKHVKAVSEKVRAGNSPANPDCWCRTCRPVVLNDMRFVVCPDCGNKRCPRANDHRNACTGSNEPGQEGSAYPDIPQSPGSEPAAVPGKWIPVSERMPDREVDVQVYCPDKKEQMVAYLERNELEGYFRFATWRTGDGIYCQPTHWMQLPAGPKEVKGE